jgi:hypothetical protein
MAMLRERMRSARIKGDLVATPKIAGAKARQAAEEYAKAFQFKGLMLEGPKHNQGVCGLIASPSPERLARINRLLDELAQLAPASKPHRGRKIRLTLLMSPIPSGRSSKRR